MVDSVLGVVNELLGAVLGKLGSALLLLYTCSCLSTPLPHGWGTREEDGAEFWDLSRLPQTDEAAMMRRPHGGVLG